MSIAPETIAVATALGAVERLIAAIDDHLETGTDRTEAELRRAQRDAEEVARRVAPHAVESRDTTMSRRDSIITGALPRGAATNNHYGSPDWERGDG